MGCEEENVDKYTERHGMSTKRNMNLLYKLYHKPRVQMNYKFICYNMSVLVTIEPIVENDYANLGG